MKRTRVKGSTKVATVGTEGMLSKDEGPLELTINNNAYYMADTEPMGVVAEIIRNDMGDSLGVLVYDDVTRQVHRFRSSQLVVREDANITVLPSWFKRSRELLRSIGPMEDAVTTIRKARRKGVRLSEEDAARATADAPDEVQRYIDEAVILRSRLIGKLHGLLHKQTSSEAQLRDLASPGFLDRTPDADRALMITTLKRSLRLNVQTITAMRDFLTRMQSSYLFPKDPRVSAMFKVDEFEAVTPATPGPVEGEMEEFETFEEAMEEFETFEEGMEEFEDVPEFGEVEPEPFPPTPPEAPHVPPPPRAVATGGAVGALALEHVEALPDADETTVMPPSLMEVGTPGWSPPPAPDAFGAPPALAPPGTVPPPPPGAGAAPPPPPIPSMVEFEATAQRKIEGEPAAPEPVAKKAGLLGRLRRGKEKKSKPVAAAAAVPSAPPPQPVVEEFEAVEEFAPLEPQATSPAPPVELPPPPSIPPPPVYTPHAGMAPQEDTFEAVEEFAPVDEMPPSMPATAAPFPPTPAPVAPPPAPAPAPAPAPIPAPAPAPVDEPVPAEEFETFEEEVAVEPEAERLDAEKDIDKILAMALGKAPPPGTRPTAKPGVREDITSPMGSLLSKTKYRSK